VDAFSVVRLVGAVGIENNADWNFKDLEEMPGSTKTSRRNNGECQGILIGPSMAPHFLGALKFLRHKFFTYCSTQEVGFRHKFRGTDGKPMMNGISTSAETKT
jgi:hypothetical protein